MTSLFYLSVLLLMLLYPEQYIPAASNALKVWGLDVVPSLFPYMVFCRLLAEQWRASCIPPTCITVFLSVLGGSPSGASVLSVYGRSMPDRILFPIAALTGTISPTFILNTVSRWILDPSVCKALLACHLIGTAFCAWITYWLVCRFPSHFQLQHSPAISGGASESPILQSVLSVLNIGGCIVIYNVVAVFICRFPLFSASQSLSAFMHSLLEMAGGIHAISTLPDTPFRKYLLCAAAGFTGFSILAQNAYFLRPLGIRMTHQILFALLRAAAATFAMAVYQALISSAIL